MPERGIFRTFTKFFGHNFNVNTQFTRFIPKDCKLYKRKHNHIFSCTRMLKMWSHKLHTIDAFNTHRTATYIYVH